MEFPPDEWNIFSVSDFELAKPRFPGDWGVEVMAKVRSNGRITDHWRVALGGSKILEATFPLSSFFPAATSLPPWKLTYQQFPRDMKIRPNMVSSAWLDVVNPLASHEFLLYISRLCQAQPTISRASRSSTGTNTSIFKSSTSVSLHLLDLLRPMST